MPMRIEYREDGGVALRCSGFATGRELIAFNEDIYATPDRTRKLAYQFCDFSGVTDFTINSEQISVLANQDERAAKTNPDMLIACVANRDVIYGLLRQWQGLSARAGLTSMIFRNTEDAEKWVTEMLSARRGGREGSAESQAGAGE